MKEGLPFFRTPRRTTLLRCPQNTDIAVFAEQCACYPYIFPTIFPRAAAGMLIWFEYTASQGDCLYWWPDCGKVQWSTCVNFYADWPLFFTQPMPISTWKRNVAQVYYTSYTVQAWSKISMPVDHKRHTRIEVRGRIKTLRGWKWNSIEDLQMKSTLPIR